MSSISRTTWIQTCALLAPSTSIELQLTTPISMDIIQGYTLLSHPGCTSQTRVYLQFALETISDQTIADIKISTNPKTAGNQMQPNLIQIRRGISQRWLPQPSLTNHSRKRRLNRKFPRKSGLGTQLQTTKKRKLRRTSQREGGSTITNSK